MTTPSELLDELEARDPLLKFAILGLENIGLNPLETTKKTLIKRFIYFVSVAIPFILLFWSIIDHRGNVRYLNMDVYSPTQQILFKFLFILYLRKNVGKVMKGIVISWPDNIFGKKLENEIKKTKNDYIQLYRKYRVVIWGTVFIYTIKAPISLYKVPLFVWHQLFDGENYKLMVLNVIFQQYYIIVVGYSLIAYDALFFALMSHCYTQFQAIKHAFESLDYDADEYVLYKKFSDIVKHHGFILETINDVNRIFSIQLLNHFFTVMISLCSGIFLLNLNGFPPSFESILTYIPYLACYHFQLYLYCAKGQDISEQVNFSFFVLYCGYRIRDGAQYFKFIYIFQLTFILFFI
ncbi:putative odorant receptor 92a [Onthophagus taurus]|uniref:putative odorant receptor 92a n=1 Tax=Onthophagus taurus TaxID=166361 RepID=UPI0039BE3B62